VRVLVSGPGGEGPLGVLRELRSRLDGALPDAELLGPAPLLRLRGRHRAQLLVKAEDPRPVAARLGVLLAAAARAMRRDDLAAAVDVDPQSL
jgi:primosomal protein N' (replication factor Y)